jgi:hypothetical protein
LMLIFQYFYHKMMGNVNERKSYKFNKGFAGFIYN